MLMLTFRNAAESLSATGAVYRLRSCRLGFSCTASLEMKNLFHAGPPLTFRPSFKRTLHRHHDGPPFLCFLIGCHFCHISGVVCAVIFEVAEEQAVLPKN